MEGIHPGEFWCVLSPNPIPMEDPDNSYYLPVKRGLIIPIVQTQTCVTPQIHPTGSNG